MLSCISSGWPASLIFLTRNNGVCTVEFSQGIMMAVFWKDWKTGLIPLIASGFKGYCFFTWAVVRFRGDNYRFTAFYQPHIIFAFSPNISGHLMGSEDRSVSDKKHASKCDSMVGTSSTENIKFGSAGETVQLVSSWQVATNSPTLCRCQCVGLAKEMWGRVPQTLKKI